MAQLRHIDGERVQTLSHHAQIGRAQDAEVRIDNPRVSSQHAALRWAGGHWELKDLGSHNGTVINGQYLDSGVWTPIDCGAAICFGAPQERWTLESADAPEVTATRLDTGAIIVGEHGFLALSELCPHTTLATEDGHTYWLQTPSVRVQVEDRAVIEIAGVRLRLSLPPAPAQGEFTVSAEDALATGIGLRFRVSSDEEHVEVYVVEAGRSVAMRHRSFDYMLLQLARARLRDASSGEVAGAECGWLFTDELAAGLDVGLQHLNVDVYRARKRFEGSGVPGAAALIERRPAQKAIRLGTAAIRIEP